MGSMKLGPSQSHLLHFFKDKVRKTETWGWGGRGWGREVEILLIIRFSYFRERRKNALRSFENEEEYF